jgi:hypothetical protein
LARSKISLLFERVKQQNDYFLEMRMLTAFTALLLMTYCAEVRGQAAGEAPDPGKEEGFKDLITENNLDEK